MEAKSKGSSESDTDGASKKRGTSAANGSSRKVNAEFIALRLKSVTYVILRKFLKSRKFNPKDDRKMALIKRAIVQPPSAKYKTNQELAALCKANGLPCHSKKDVMIEMLQENDPTFYPYQYRPLSRNQWWKVLLDFANKNAISKGRRVLDSRLGKNMSDYSKISDSTIETDDETSHSDDDSKSENGSTLAQIQLSTAMKEIVSLKEQMKRAQSKILSEQSNARKYHGAALKAEHRLKKATIEITCLKALLANARRDSKPQARNGTAYENYGQH